MLFSLFLFYVHSVCISTWSVIGHFAWQPDIVIGEYKWQAQDSRLFPFWFKWNFICPGNSSFREIYYICWAGPGCTDDNAGHLDRKPHAVGDVPVLGDAQQLVGPGDGVQVGVDTIVEVSVCNLSMFFQNQTISGGLAVPPQKFVMICLLNKLVLPLKRRKPHQVSIFSWALQHSDWAGLSLNCLRCFSGHGSWGARPANTGESNNPSSRPGTKLLSGIFIEFYFSAGSCRLQVSAN